MQKCDHYWYTKIGWPKCYKKLDPLLPNCTNKSKSLTSTNNDNSTSSFLIWIPGLIAPVRTSSTTLSKSGDGGHPYLVPDPIGRKVNKETLKLKHPLDQMDLADISTTFHPRAAEYTFFSSAQRTFSRIDHVTRYMSTLLANLRWLKSYRLFWPQ